MCTAKRVRIIINRIATLRLQPFLMCLHRFRLGLAVKIENHRLGAIAFFIEATISGASLHPSIYLRLSLRVTRKQSLALP